MDCNAGEGYKYATSKASFVYLDWGDIIFNVAAVKLQNPDARSQMAETLLRNVGHKSLDRQDHSCNGGGIFQRSAGNPGRVDDAGQHHILILP
jgi:hypothetical protein